MRIFYDDDAFAAPELTGVDNVAISPAGDVLVAEDGGDMQIVAHHADAAKSYPLLQVVGHLDSEIAGPAFDPVRHAPLLQLAARAQWRSDRAGHHLRGQRAVHGVEDGAIRLAPRTYTGVRIAVAIAA